MYQITKQIPVFLDTFLLAVIEIIIIWIAYPILQKQILPIPYVFQILTSISSCYPCNIS
jgi:hypothetical protein